MDFSFVIITGLSGAGKSVAAKALEDVGYFCIDNIPTPLIMRIFEMKDDFFRHRKNVAFVVDIRNGEDFSQLKSEIERMKNQYRVKVIYLDADEKVIIDRYKETRRRHPLMLDSDFTLEEAVRYEKNALSKLYERADCVIDTSILSTSQLRDRVLSYVLGDRTSFMSVEVISFGFKYGVPSDVDMIFDVRCLPNPFYVKELKNLTGNDMRVRDFVFSGESAEKLFEKQTDLIDFSLPLYISEGKSNLVIGYGCTGGKHRSVVFANALYAHIRGKGYKVDVHHRDILRGR